MEKIADILRELGLTFVPLFVAMDAFGVLPILISLIQDATQAERYRMIRFGMC